MGNKDLTITITGPTKSGKSTLAVIITKALLQAGILVEVKEDMSHHAMERLHQMSEYPYLKGRHVHIEMVSTQREPAKLP